MDPMRRIFLGILAAFVLLASTACTVTQKDPDYVPPAPLPVLEQLKSAPLTDPATLGAGQDYLSFVTGDHNVVCSLTSARGGHINLPYEQNAFSAAGPISQLPVLDDGKNVERNGLRCSAYNGGVACGNISAGVGFFIARDRYELILPAAKTASPAPSEASKTP